MRKLAVQCTMSSHELIMIRTPDIDRVVRERLARELAHLLLKEMELTESMDCMSMSKVIKATILLADDKDVKLLYEAEKFINNTKEEY